MSKGTTRATVVLKTGIQVDLRVVPAASYGAAILAGVGAGLYADPEAGLASLERDLEIEPPALVAPDSHGKDDELRAFERPVLFVLGGLSNPEAIPRGPQLLRRK